LISTADASCWLGFETDDLNVGAGCSGHLFGFGVGRPYPTQARSGSGEVGLGDAVGEADRPLVQLDPVAVDEGLVARFIRTAMPPPEQDEPVMSD